MSRKGARAMIIGRLARDPKLFAGDGPKAAQLVIVRTVIEHGEENAVEMVTVNDELWFDMDDIWDGEEDEEDEEEYEEALCFDLDGEDENNFVDRYGIHPGRITCYGCHSVFEGNPFVDDGASEYCSKECAEANGATGVHEDLARCMWCDHMVHGCWWSDNDGNFFCSKICAIRYNVGIDETIKDDNETEDEDND